MLIIASVSDKNRWDNSSEHCFFFTSGSSPRPPNVVYCSLLTKSSSPTLEGLEDS